MELIDHGPLYAGEFAEIGYDELPCRKPDGEPVEAINAILECDKPVIHRANGSRIAGGQEIGMACGFTIASDMATFGQAGPRHGSAPDGGATDFLHLYVGFAAATESLTLCRTWSAHQALRLGLVNEIVPVLVVDGRFHPNPLVVTDRWIDPETGRIVYGEPKEGEALEQGKRLLDRGRIDLSRLDEAVARLSSSLLVLMPDCLVKTLESLRRKKKEHWDGAREINRAWLSLNMMTEGRAGFAAFDRGPRGDREVDFVELRRSLARGDLWDDALLRRILPASAREP